MGLVSAVMNKIDGISTNLFGLMDRGLPDVPQNVLGLPTQLSAAHEFKKMHPTTMSSEVGALPHPVFDDPMEPQTSFHTHRLPRQFFSMRQIDAWFDASDIAQTILRSVEEEIFRNGLDIFEKFDFKCRDCGKEFSEEQYVCDECEGKIMSPNWVQRKVLNQWLSGSVNSFDQTLVQVLRQGERDLNKYDNAFIYLEKNYVFDTETKRLKSNPIEGIHRMSPYWTRKIHSKYGVGRDNNGQYGYVCVEHRTQIHWKKHRGSNYKCPECERQMFRAEFQVTTEATEKNIRYYVKGEVRHLIKYEPNPGYGVSRMNVIWLKLSTLYKMDQYIYKMFSLQRSPKGLLFMRGRQEDIERSWEWMSNMAATNPNMVYPLAVSPSVSDKSSDMAQFIDLAIDFNLMQYIETRREYRQTIGMVYGVEPIFQGDLSSGGGLNNEGLQVTVTNRAIQSGQNIWNNDFFHWFSEQVGVDDLLIQLNENEEKDQMAKINRETARIGLATQIQMLGYDIDVYIGEDGVDFKIGEKQEGGGMMGGQPGMDGPGLGGMDDMFGGNEPVGPPQEGAPDGPGEQNSADKDYEGQPDFL